MSARTSKLLLLVALAACACRREIPPAPALTKVEPPASHGFDATPVQLLGGPFTRRIRVELDAPDESRETGSFSAWLVSGDLRVPLNEVAFVSATELSAVVPGGVAGGTFDVEVEDPWGRKATLPGGFVVAPQCLVPSDCDDGLPCTLHACIRYVCVRTVAAGQCFIDGACHAEGELQPDVPCHGCVPPTSQAAWSPLPNGTPCEDGDLCTLGETCQLGTCGDPTGAVSCPATACLDNHCDPATGQCASAERFGPCEDGYDCTADDACQGGECRGTPVCGNTAPMPCFQARPSAARAPAIVTVDPSCAFDLEDPRAVLRARWDLNGDGLFDTGYLPLAPQQVTLATAGMYRISMEVVDSAGLTGATAHDVSVATAAEDLVVTTRFDENDPVADPRYPGGTGLSLREAIRYANDAGIPMAIRFLAPMQISAAALPALSKAGARIVGQPGVAIDFSLSSSSATACLALNGTGERLIGIEAYGCRGQAMLSLSSTAPLASVSDSSLDGGAGSGIVVAGDHASVGPGVVVSGFASNGIELKKAGAAVYESTVRANGGNGIEVGQAPAAMIRKDVVARNGLAGIVVKGTQANAYLWNNTVHGNGIDTASSGISAVTNTQGIDARNNLLTANGGFALCGPASSFAAEDPNGMSGNALGTYCTGAPDGGSFAADAGYLAPDRGDFRLRPGSPAVNAGAIVDPALDLNGISDGGWSGSLPDLGAWESPY